MCLESEDMSEWRKVTSGRYKIKIGAFSLLIDKRKKEWLAFIEDTCILPLSIKLMADEQAQAAALAWARSVLGKALVEAGAETMTLFHCKNCDETRDSQSCFCVKPDFEKISVACIVGA